MGYPYCGARFLPICGSLTSPLVYSEDLSIAQQIAHIFALLGEMRNYLTIDEFNRFLGWLATEQDAQTLALQQFAQSEDVKLKAELEKLIGDIIAGIEQWNVQKGRYTNTVEAQRDMFNDLAVHALSVEQVAEQWTVDELAETPLTVRGLAVWSGEYVTPGYVDDGIYQKEDE